MDIKFRRFINVPRCDIMGKIVVFVFDGITDYEITFLTHLLKADAGMDVITVSYAGSFITGKSGLTYKVDKQLKDIEISEVDGLIIGGGCFGDKDPFPRENYIKERINNLPENFEILIERE